VAAAAGFDSLGVAAAPTLHIAVEAAGVEHHIRILLAAVVVEAEGFGVDAVVGHTDSGTDTAVEAAAGVEVEVGLGIDS
jgi:hypothetical protein